MSTYRVTYRAGRGARRLLEDVEADGLRREAVCYVLVRDVLVVNRPRVVVALRVMCRDVHDVRCLCPGRR